MQGNVFKINGKTLLISIFPSYSHDMFYLLWKLTTILAHILTKFSYISDLEHRSSFMFFLFYYFWDELFCGKIVTFSFATKYHFAIKIIERKWNFCGKIAYFTIFIQNTILPQNELFCHNVPFAMKILYFCKQYFGAIKVY